MEIKLEYLKGRTDISGDFPRLQMTACWMWEGLYTARYEFLSEKNQGVSAPQLHI